jgi:UPF0755 protein
LLGKNLENSQYITKKKKTGLYIAIGLLTVLLFTSISLGFWVNSTIKSKNSNNTEKKTITITSGQGLEEISNNLSDAGLVKNPFVFGLYLKYKGMAGKVMAGEYQIPQNLTMIELSTLITEGMIVTNKITIPEGWTIDQIGDYLEKNTVISKSDFLIATRKEYGYEFLKERPAGSDLEGYLYPDTYILDATPTADEVIKKMLDNFDLKYTDAIRTKAKSSNMTGYEIVTLASVVEREVANTADRKIVAGIFLNRLNNDMPLESCATIQYILKENKKQFTYEETRTPSLYNTYLNVGLPKGPIGNPSIESIEAVLAPEKTSYFYFLTGNDGKTYFSTTLDEHNTKKAKYLD